MVKKLLHFFLLFLTLTSLSQERKTLLSGKIVDSLGLVKNANIINLKTNQGTFSSDNGSFRLFVSKGDSIQISTIQHITKKIIINQNVFENRRIVISLKLNTYTLDEFELKKHNLTSILSLDIKAVPTDKKGSLLRTNMDFSKINFNAPMKSDHIARFVKPHIVKTEHTIDAGFGLKKSFPLSVGNSKKRWSLNKHLDQRKAFPYKLFSELGEKFFFEELKIPINKYFHFLEYCNPLDIENLHKENKLLEIIKILQQESITYLEIIKKE